MCVCACVCAYVCVCMHVCVCVSTGMCVRGRGLEEGGRGGRERGKEEGEKKGAYRINSILLYITPNQQPTLP